VCIPLCIAGLNQKIKMFKYFFSAASLLLSLGCYAQHALTGIVRDERTHQVLTGATVQLAGTNQVAIADAFGRFGFYKLSPAQYTLEVKFLGYSPASETVNLTADIQVNITLDETSILTEAVVVSATRATGKTPTTHTTLSQEKIRQQNFGQDLPLLLNWTPSVVTTSDAGNGIGYTGIRIRGSDPARINVTINGIPYNDSESMGTFWVNIPDIASSAGSIQIQRGVGTSTNGAGAFGASVNLQTNLRNNDPYAEVVNSFGSFDSRRHTLNFGTGLLKDHWVIDGRLSKITSDGFIDRASSDLKSYYFSGGFYADKTMVKFVAFGGKERTYQSWYGVPESRLNNDNEAMLITAMNEGWNDQQTQNLLTSNSRTFNPYQYKNQVDDYHQDNYQLHFSQQFGTSVTLNTALHYTPGKGFYEEYRYKNKLEDYGLTPVVIGDSVVSRTDLIRRRWLDNDFYGFTYALNFDQEKWNVVLGGAWNRYDGDHFGEIIWAQVSPVPHEYQYYFNNGDKRDFNSYLKANYEISSTLNAFADLQYRKITYTVSGIENERKMLAIDKTFNFFNPKAGLTFSVSDAHQLYASYSIGNREPVRNDFVDNIGNTPKHETLRNLEIGYRGRGERHTLHLNYYLMDYNNQLVLTGQLNDVGATIRQNVPDSYRTGVEIEGLLKLSDNIQWNANLTLSRNKIKNFTEVLYDYGAAFDERNVVERNYKNTDISFSPSVIAGSALSFYPFKNAEITWLSKYVGKQYLDNTSNDARSLNAYFVNDIRLAYRWHPTFVKEINLSLLVNNILDEEYESNGFTYGYLAGEEFRENFFYPQAGINFMAMVGIRF
jgi:iron complex outermembrane recepter protein